MKLPTTPTLTVDELADLLGISRPTAYDQVQRGRWRAVKVGRRVLVLTAPLLAELGIISRPEDFAVNVREGLS